MPSTSLTNKAVKATKWSATTEIVAKLVLPISNIVLARLLAPEAFGIVATITMVVTFAEVFTDAGFQKYLIQHEFENEQDLKLSTTVAFWSNFIMSLLFWAVIVVFRNPIAEMVGNPGMGFVLVIASISIPLAAFSSIQIALYKRALDYKTLFKVRIVGVSIPLLVTIPCALLLKNFWALIIGILVRDLANAVILTWYSSWKPNSYYSFDRFKKMFSFTSWSLVEAITIWLTGYADIFIVGSVLNQYYLGLYKTSVSFVSSITGMVTAATASVLFSSLSRLQNDGKEFESFFLKFQRLVSILVIPIGVGIFGFCDFITSFLLGNKWTEAAGFIGLWGLSSSVVIVLSNYASEIYRAKGKPKLSVLSQSLHLIVLLPSIIVTVKYGYEALYTTRALVRFQAVLVDLLLLYFFIKLSPAKLLFNVIHPFIASFFMLSVCLLLRLYLPNTTLWGLLSIIVCAVVYILVLCLFKEDKTLILNLYNSISKKHLKS